MQIPVAGLPGFTTERLIPPVPVPGPILTEEMVRCNGTHVGNVVYCRRQLPAGGSLYGWRPAALRSNAALTEKAEAIRRMVIVLDAV